MAGKRYLHNIDLFLTSDIPYLESQDQTEFGLNITYGMCKTLIVYLFKITDFIFQKKKNLDSIYLLNFH